ncbi:MAG: prenylcysteine alpha-carboxyl methylesterase [Devosia sp.]|uniref:alpha/beta hydrolase n=1 Tax=Devosia sp. TaxID=1871048 RepID=UPI002604D8D2|nr:alpha/beta hydrolase [Devosia sp.]MDB5539506.1 prenylcysteine alpha-carboxyl methylesterase [Devosia sp.]
MIKPIKPALRFVLVLLLAIAGTIPAVAQVTIFSPFNIAEAMDQGVKKTADIPYADGQRKKLDIYQPEKADGPAPVVMFIYGGSWRAGDKFEYEFAGRALAAAGFVTVIADYRLWPEVKYPEFLEDNAQAMRWIEDNIAQYGGDPKRFFLAGHSAGAYNAVMLGLDSSFRREYKVTMPIRAIAGISGPYNFYPFEYDQVRDTFGPAPSAEGTQPVNLVTADAPPIFLASGTSDPIVRVQNSEALAAKLREQGVWVTEKYYEGFGHLEPVLALGAMMRFRMPILNDLVEFFQTFGAFPSGTPRPVFTPDPPETEMTAVIKKMDDVLAPIDGGQGSE